MEVSFSLGIALYQHKIYLIETDSIGNLIWSKKYGIDITTDVFIRKLSDGFLLSAHSYTLKLDSIGNISLG
jgi:hypothetical protein